MRKSIPLLCCLMLCGCDGLLFPAGSKPNVNVPHDSKPSTETVFIVLADNAAADPAYYATTDDLKRTVNRLVRDKRISQAQSDRVTELLGKERRAITPKDLEAIKGL